MYNFTQFCCPYHQKDWTFVANLRWYGEQGQRRKWVDLHWWRLASELLGYNLLCSAKRIKKVLEVSEDEKKEEAEVRNWGIGKPSVVEDERWSTRVLLKWVNICVRRLDWNFCDLSANACQVILLSTGWEFSSRNIGNNDFFFIYKNSKT